MASLNSLKNIVVMAEQPFLDRVLVNKIIHEVLPIDIVVVQLNSAENNINIGVKDNDERVVRPIMRAELSQELMAKLKDLSFKMKDEVADLSSETLDLYHRSDLTFSPYKVEMSDNGIIDIYFYIENYDDVVDIDWLLNRMLSAV